MTDPTPLCSISRNTLHDLTVCARHVVGQLTGDSLVAAALAIREADAELKRADTPVPPAADAPKEISNAQ